MVVMVDELPESIGTACLLHNHDAFPNGKRSIELLIYTRTGVDKLQVPGEKRINVECEFRIATELIFGSGLNLIYSTVR